MKNRLEIPDDLAHLIEKREGDRRGSGAKPASSGVDETGKTPAKPRKERRSGRDRRKS